MIRRSRDAGLRREFLLNDTAGQVDLRSVHHGRD